MGGQNEENKEIKARGGNTETIMNGGEEEEEVEGLGLGYSVY